MAKRKFSKLPPLDVGDKVGHWTILEMHEFSRAVTVQCRCGTTRYMRLSKLRHHAPKQCRNCLLRERRERLVGQPTTQRVRTTLQSLSQWQMSYAAALIRSRRQIAEQELTRSDVLEAIEMAALLTPAQCEAELAQLTPHYHAEVRQTHTQYQTMKGFL